MYRFTARRWVGRRWACVGLAILFCGVSNALVLRAADPASALDAALAAGEFSAALQSADAQTSAADRDAALQRVASAQLRAGAERAAAASTAAIRDDRTRRQAFDQLFQFGSAADPLSPPTVADSTSGPAGGGNLGGGVQPDFDQLIDLITSTIRPSDWSANGGTIGQIVQHDGGVFVDAAGVMRQIVNTTEAARLAALRREAARDSTPGGARQTSSLRKISLSRLERELQLRRALGLPLDEEMRTLAGLRRVTHVFVYPNSGEVVLAGPAGDWYLGRESRILSVADDRPVVLLDDFITLLRREFNEGGFFSCSIEPTSDGLQNVRAFADSSRTKPLAAGDLARWTNRLRDAVGRQNIVFRGIDPQTRAARILVEADYHMKLLGIDRAPSVLQVPSYFQIVKNSGREPPSLGLLRWWFTANYDALLTTSQRDAYELRGQGVQLQSEDEFLSAQGERVSTGKADDRNAEYSANFTEHFPVLAQKYPLYADLQNIFDLALVCAVLKHDGVCERAGWQHLGLTDPQLITPDRDYAPATVDSVANSTMLGKSRVMAVISGGVRVDVAPLAQASAMQQDERGALSMQRQSAAPGRLEIHTWWWD